MNGWWRVVPPIALLFLMIVAMSSENDAREQDNASAPDAAMAHDAGLAHDITYYHGDPTLQPPQRRSRRRFRSPQRRPAQEQLPRVSSPMNNGVFGTLRENPHIPLF